MEKYYFGVDIALRKSGLIVLDEKMSVVHRGILIVPAKLDLTDAVLKIYEDISEVYRLLPSDSEVVTIMEDVSGRRKRYKGWRGRKL